MSFSHFSALVSVALAATQASNALNTNQKRVTCADGNVTANEVCCQLFPVVANLQQNLFDGATCGEEAHSALRLAFHDAMGFSVNGGKGGGADGSILAFNSTELAYHANAGIDDIIAAQWPVFQTTNLTAGDFVHLAAAVGTANCPGAPQLSFFFGRAAPSAAAPDLTVPEPTDSVDDILDRFDDAGFSADELVALLASHTIAAADEVDPSIPGTPFDSTPSTFDTQFYLEVMLNGTSYPGAGEETGEVLSPIPGEMRLESDYAISRDNRTSCMWQSMINNQDDMVSQFKAAMQKLSLLGLDQSTLTDCSDVVPTPASLTTDSAYYPAGYGSDDLEGAYCTSSAYPSLTTGTGAQVSVAPVAD